MSSDTPDWKAMGGGSPQQVRFLQEQVGNLQQLKKVLEDLLAQKQIEKMSLQEKLLRLKHGGGQ